MNTLFQEKKKHHNRKDEPKETPKLDPFSKLQLVAGTVSTEFRSESCPWTKTVLTLRLESLSFPIIIANRKGQWSFIGPGTEKSGIVSVKTVHKEYGTIWLKGCCWNSQKVIVQFSALRQHLNDPFSRCKSVQYMATGKN